MDSRSQSPCLAGLRKAVGDFLDLMDEVLSTDSQQLTSRVPQLHQRTKYMHFQPQETHSLLLEQLISKLEECKREVCTNLENKMFKQPSMTWQMSKTLEMIWEEKRALMKMKAECKDVIVMRAVLSTMQRQVKEKNEEIARLRRASIVQLWERERQKVLCEVLEREQALKEETEDKTAQWMELKEKLTKKLKGQEEEIQKLRLKEKMYAKSLSHLETRGLKEELKYLRQQLLLAEKDLRDSHSEILMQQQRTATYLKGLNTDLQKAAVKQSPGYYLSSEDFQYVCSQLEVLCRAARDGTLRTLPSGSPEALLTLPQVTFHPSLEDVPVLFQASTAPPENGRNLNGREVPEKHKGKSAVPVNRLASATAKKTKKGRRRSKAGPHQRSIDQSELRDPLSKSLTPPSCDPPSSSFPTDQDKLTNGDDKVKDDQSDSQEKGQMTAPKAVWGVVQNAKLKPDQKDSHLSTVSGFLDVELTRCHNQSFRDHEHFPSRKLHPVDSNKSDKLLLSSCCPFSTHLMCYSKCNVATCLGCVSKPNFNSNSFCSCRMNSKTGNSDI
ncbi:uncharacterized protein LOC119976533 [Scyliorhinus canicula]|uniref:uncharacterized protein LOC119976533 n=1 Tax=Scyliorhinus canicula TaxID=7830 RepID=UPI0018F57DA3|nr:uncharacterized protein LOC119976533 [Scyliorhinus canicula]